MATRQSDSRGVPGPSIMEFDATVLDHNPDAVMVLDPRGRVLYWNRAAEAIFGYAAAEAVGRACEICSSPGQAEQFADDCAVPSRAGCACTSRCAGARDGTCLHVSGSVRRCATPAACCSASSTKKDVTPLKVQRATSLVEARYRDLLEDTPDARF